MEGQVPFHLYLHLFAPQINNNDDDEDEETDEEPERRC